MSSVNDERGRSVAILRNPRSGSGLRRHEVLELVRELKRLGFRPKLFKNRERLHDWIECAGARENLACLVAAGGDGTVADAFNRHPGTKLAILPLGTENLLARHLGIPRSGREVARLIAAGHSRTLDLCTIGKRRFSLMASVGFDADVIQRVHHARSGNISRFSYIQPILQSVRSYEYPELRLWLDDDQAPVTARLAVICNLPIYALGLAVARSARGDDGLLDVRLFRRGSAFQMVRYLCNLALGTHERLWDVESRQARRVRIEADVPVPVQTDGDAAGFTPAEICVLPSALEVITPET